jgi:hypothetical protein
VSVTPAIGASTVAGRIHKSRTLYSIGSIAEYALSTGRSPLLSMLRARSEY